MRYLLLALCIFMFSCNTKKVEKAFFDPYNDIYLRKKLYSLTYKKIIDSELGKPDFSEKVDGGRLRCTYYFDESLKYRKQGSLSNLTIYYNLKSEIVEFRASRNVN